jgi:hypothetical protein
MEPEAKDLSEFLKLARSECCNYSDTGPFRKRHYCWLEPEQSDKRCLLEAGLACKWFFEAVLPVDQDLLEEWQNLWNLTSDPVPFARAFRTCRCGKRYKARSNRQRMCPECARENRKRLNRYSKRRERGKKG